jgi:hypothetical protein
VEQNTARETAFCLTLPVYPDETPECTETDPDLVCITVFAPDVCGDGDCEHSNKQCLARGARFRNDLRSGSLNSLLGESVPRQDCNHSQAFSYCQELKITRISYVVKRTSLSTVAVAVHGAT